MKVRRSRIGVPAGTDRAEPLAPLDLGALLQTRRIRLQMRVVMKRPAVRRADVDGVAAGIGFEKLLDRPAGGGEDGGARWRHDIERFVPAFAAARLIESVGELREGNTRDGN